MSKDKELVSKISEMMYSLPAVNDPNVEWQHMWEEFKKIDDIEIKITQSKFKKFEPLYQAINIKDKNQYTADEFKILKDLSTELINTVNPYKKFYVVDDIDHNKIIYELPAIFNRVNLLNEHKEDKDTAVTANNVFDNLGSHQMKYYRFSGAQYLLQMIKESQSVEEYITNMIELGELSAKFHNDPRVAAIDEQLIKLLETVENVTDDGIIYKED